MEKHKFSDALYALGNAPSEGEKVIYIHQTRKVSKEILPDLFRFSLEAYSSGYSIICLFYNSTVHTILEAAFMLDRPLYVMRTLKLDGMKLNEEGNRLMLVRGGYLSPVELGNDWKTNTDKAQNLALDLSTAVLILDNDFNDMAREALDSGKDIAVLRSSLEDRKIRMLVREGCPVIDSFSSWMEMPRSISFKLENGPFRDPCTGERYSLLILSEKT